MRKIHLQFEHHYAGYFSKFWLTLLLIIFGILLFNQTQPSWAWYARFFSFTCLISLLLVGHQLGYSMISGARVFSAMQTPGILWRTWRLKLIKRASIWSAIALGAISLLELSHQALFSNLTLLTLISVSMSVGFVLPLLLNRYLNTYLNGLSIGLALYLLLLEESLFTNDFNLFSWWSLPLCLMWPLIAFFTLHFWKNAPAPRGIAFHQQIKNLKVFQILKHFYLSFTSIDRHHAAIRSKTIPKAGLATKAMGLVFIGIFTPTMLLKWGQGISLLHCSFLIFVAIISSSHIMGKDLHWRYLLRPHTLSEGRIATHLLLSSLVYYAIWSCILFFAVFSVKLLLTQKLTMPDVSSMFNFAMLLIQLMSAFCIGLVIRGSRNPSRVIFYIFLSSVLFTALISTYLYLQKQAPLSSTLFNMGFTYLFIMLMMASVAMIYANKQWTRTHLLKHL